MLSGWWSYELSPKTLQKELQAETYSYLITETLGRRILLPLYSLNTHLLNTSCEASEFVGNVEDFDELEKLCSRCLLFKTDIFKVMNINWYPSLLLNCICFNLEWKTSVSKNASFSMSKNYFEFFNLKKNCLPVFLS